MSRCYYCLSEHDARDCIRKATERIVESNETVAKSLGTRIELVEGSIDELHEYLSWANSEHMWQLEQQTELLTGIRDAVVFPRATEVDELFHMGVNSFKRHRNEDALNLLLEARRLNPGDYRVLITLGHIYVQLGSLSEAVKSFEAAADYARTKVYERNALLLLCRTYRVLSWTNDAIATAQKAVALTPDYPLSRYELAAAMSEGLDM